MKSFLAAMLLLNLGGCSAPGPAPSSPTPRLLHVPQQPAKDAQAQASVKDDQVQIVWSDLKAPVKIYRSTTPLTPTNLNQERVPVGYLGEAQSSPFLDKRLGRDVDYHYLLVSGQDYLTVGPIRLDNIPLQVAQNPRLEIDKASHALSVYDSTRVLKRYPMVMGRLSQRRKLCYDNASTPEGRYQIIHLQPDATFYRAYDIDYPNAVDQARYALLKPSADIGGEIQIHGRGIHTNWTFGCVALRDSDMDELFAHSELGTGCPVWIYGSEITRADLESDALGSRWDPKSLGKKQKALGLPVTCLMDVATRQALKPENP